MNAKPLVIATLATLATLAAALAPPASADVKPIPAPAGKPALKSTPAVAPRAPVDLAGKRLNLFDSAFRRAGLPGLRLPPPPPYVHLTPSTPTGPGAKITRVGRSIFYGPAADTPEGAFLIEPGPVVNLPGPFGSLPGPPGPTGRVELDVTVEGGKAYMVDCRLTTAGIQGPIPGGQIITFARSSTSVTQQVNADDGHYLYPFRADATGPMSLSLTFVHDWAFFHGCEITKIN